MHIICHTYCIPKCPFSIHACGPRAGPCHASPCGCKHSTPAARHRWRIGSNDALCPSLGIPATMGAGIIGTADPSYHGLMRSSHRSRLVLYGPATKSNFVSQLWTLPIPFSLHQFASPQSQVPQEQLHSPQRPWHRIDDQPPCLFRAAHSVWAFPRDLPTNECCQGLLHLPAREEVSMFDGKGSRTAAAQISWRIWSCTERRHFLHSRLCCKLCCQVVLGGHQIRDQSSALSLFGIFQAGGVVIHCARSFIFALGGRWGALSSQGTKLLQDLEVLRRYTEAA